MTLQTGLKYRAELDRQVFWNGGKTARIDFCAVSNLSNHEGRLYHGWYSQRSLRSWPLASPPKSQRLPETSIQLEALSRAAERFAGYVTPWVP